MNSIGRARVVTRALSRELSDVASVLRRSKIVNNFIERKFEVVLNDYTASVTYVELPGAYDLVYSYIPQQYHGHGLGGMLAEKVFNHIINQNKKIKLTCHFLERYYRRNEERYRKHVISGSGDDDTE